MVNLEGKINSMYSMYRGDKLKMKKIVIKYGDIQTYANVGSVIEFYDKLGITPRLNEKDIRSPRSLQMGYEDAEKLRKIIIAELIQRNQKRWGYKAVIYKSLAFWDWINFGPRYEDDVPAGELWAETYIED